jgi:microcystin-dependent protein
MSVVIYGNGNITGIVENGLPAGCIHEDNFNSSSKVQWMVPKGAVAMFPLTTMPSGWLKCNGAAISRTTYSDLFAAIGTTYGSGNGSTTFNIPDYRGEFLRSWDDGKGIDSGRSIGSWQKGTIISWNIPYNEGLGGTAAFGPSGNQSNPTAQQNAGADPSTNQSGTAGNYWNPTRSVHVGGPPQRDSDWMNANGWGGGQTRPRNVAIAICIKY